MCPEDPAVDGRVGGDALGKEVLEGGMLTQGGGEMDPVSGYFGNGGGNILIDMAAAPHKKGNDHQLLRGKVLGCAGDLLGERDPLGF